MAAEGDETMIGAVTRGSLWLEKKLLGKRRLPDAVPGTSFNIGIEVIYTAAINNIENKKVFCYSNAYHWLPQQDDMSWWGRAGQNRSDI